MAKGKRTNNDLQNTTQKTKDRVRWTLLATVGELMCSGRSSSFCPTSGTRRVTLVTNPVIMVSLYIYIYKTNLNDSFTVNIFHGIFYTIVLILFSAVYVCVISIYKFFMRPINMIYTNRIVVILSVYSQKVLDVIVLDAFDVYHQFQQFKHYWTYSTYWEENQIDVTTWQVKPINHFNPATL